MAYVKLLSAFLLIACFSCNNPLKEKESVGYRITDECQLDSISVQLINLNKSFQLGTNMKFDSIWKIIVRHKYRVIPCLVYHRNFLDVTNNWLFINRRLRGREKEFYSCDVRTRNSSYAILYLISAMYYEDYFFADTRSLYDTTRYNREQRYYLHQIPKLDDYIDDLQIWTIVERWVDNGMNGRPLNGTDFYWIGEKEATLDLNNVKLYLGKACR